MDKKLLALKFSKFNSFCCFGNVWNNTWEKGMFEDEAVIL